MKPPVLTDQEWMDSLHNSPAYTGIDIAREYSKMCVRCEVWNQKPTRRRFVAWLNRIDVPMSITPEFKAVPATRIKTAFELKTIREAKEKLANELQFRYATEDAMGWHWDDTLKRGEWQKLRQAISDINRQIAGLL